VVPSAIMSLSQDGVSLSFHQKQSQSSQLVFIPPNL
jgi:hypothetical protein